MGQPAKFVSLAGLRVAKVKPDSSVHGFVRESDGITPFNAPCAGASTFPNSINAAGNYYGCGAAHGFVRDRDGKITTLDPPGSTYTMPTSINDAGAITGWYVDASRVTHGFLRSPGQRAQGKQQH